MMCIFGGGGGETDPNDTPADGTGTVTNNTTNVAQAPAPASALPAADPPTIGFARREESRDAFGKDNPNYRKRRGESVDPNKEGADYRAKRVNKNVINPNAPIKM